MKPQTMNPERNVVANLIRISSLPLAAAIIVIGITAATCMRSAESTEPAVTSAPRTATTSPGLFVPSKVVDSNDPGSFEMPDEGFIGIARPSEEAELPPLVPGLISTVLVTGGQYVSKGTPLIALDDQVPRARLQAATVEAGLTGALKRAQVDLRMAESRLERLRFAVQSGAGAVFELEEAESVVEQTRAVVQQQSDLLRAAEANRQLAEAQLKQYTVHAPFDGVVTTIHQRSGMVEPSRPVVAIANLNRLDVELHLPSRLYGKIKTGQTLPLLASSPVHQPISGNVVSVSPVINAASDTFRCRLEILNANKLLPAGFTVRLDSSNKNVATVGI